MQGTEEWKDPPWCRERLPKGKKDKSKLDTQKQRLSSRGSKEKFEIQRNLKIQSPGFYEHPVGINKENYPHRPALGKDSRSGE